MKLKQIFLILAIGLTLALSSCAPLHTEKIDKYIVSTYKHRKTAIDTTTGEIYRLSMHELGYQKYPDLDYNLFTNRTPRFRK